MQFLNRRQTLDIDEEMSESREDYNGGSMYRWARQEEVC